ncbi:MAG: hypothetical protein ACK4ZW_08430 [Blastomonas sp.]
MPEEKPFGWRDGMVPYQPDEYAVLAYKLACALLYTSARRFGPEFIHEVRSELQRTVEKDADSENVEDRVESDMLVRWLSEIDWDKLTREASGD